ncbi:MAG: sigma-E processing peptidase SpoIIGA [Clostridia bacterium]|nr:sigma-E processing peptidase SpoIIGA [Clostridia bacterium]
MKTIIYVDVLLAINLLITYILLLLTCVVLKMYAKKTRLFLGSVLGSIYSLLVLAPELGFIASLLLKFFMCISIVCVAFQLKNFRIVCRFSICFFAVNISFSGLMLLLSNLLNSKFVQVRNANIYMNIDFPILIALTCVCYVILKFVINLFHRTPSNELYRVRIYINDLFVEATAVTDTGNALYEPISGKPVCILCQCVLMPLLPKSIQAFIDGDLKIEKTFDHGWETRISVICTEFAVGSALLPTVKVDEIEIMKGNQIVKYQNCVLALTKKSFDDMQCQMLLHPSLITLPIKQEVTYENSIQ